MLILAKEENNPVKKQKSGSNKEEKVVQHCDDHQP
jgi:hypothetical protein